jgi:sterol desaturase/sphingolipid hydroxylase (fatty acid hydroxylase superfamily)
VASPDDLGAHIEHEMRVAQRRFRSRIAVLAGASIVLDLVAAGLAKWFEDDAPHRFPTYLDALFWTTTQLLTVSSQLPNPERAPTKVLDVVLEAWAIIVVASLAATFSDLLHHRTRHRALRERRAAPPGAGVR